MEGHEKEDQFLTDDDHIIIKKGTKEEMEREIYQKLYAQCGYNATRLAESLGVSRTTVWKKLNKQE